jgi:two-component system, chemotaxis family, chemotaxis protein CheY
MGGTVSLNVLVVDDSAVLRAMVIRSLQMSGLPLDQVHQAGDGAAGLRVLKDYSIDLALVDINMPVMSGQEMIERLRLIPAFADLPVVVVSTDSTQARREALEAHRVTYLPKPFTPEQLRQTVLITMGIANAGICATGFAAGGDLDF